MVQEFNKGEFIGEMMADSGYLSSNLLRAVEESVLLRIRKDDVYELLADRIALTERFLEFI
jgi:CRP-like cAMP-binding protein